MIGKYEPEIVISACREFREVSGFLQSKVLSMWRAYFDESGHAKDSSQPIVAMAGCVGDCDAWLDFIPEWLRVLATYGIRVFHAKDFAQLVGEFKGWSEDRRQALTNDLFLVIEKARVYTISCAVLMEDYRNLSVDDKNIIESPYHLLFQKCLTMVVHLDCFSDNDKVAVMFEDNDEFSRRALQLWSDTKKTNFWKTHGHRFHTVAFGPKSFVPLQVADFLAYESNKFVKFDKGYDTKQKEARYPFLQFFEKTVFDGVQIIDTDGFNALLVEYERNRLQKKKGS